jgi:hypothetical protein
MTLERAMNFFVILAATFALITSAVAQGAGGSSGNCKIIERDGSPPGSCGAPLSSSVIAGGGQVSAQTTGGNSVSVHSGNGRVSSSSSTTTAAGGQSQTVVTNLDGSCTIYRYKEK